MAFEWFRPRTYRHFDHPVGLPFLERAVDPLFVARHSFSPLISRPDETRRYKPKINKTTTKRRPIMYSSHRDAAIFSWYSSQLNELLERFYTDNKLGESVIAYRALGRANYDFSAEAREFAVHHAPCTVLAFDVTGFFDNLSHNRLKSRLKELLSVDELPDDWYAVYRAITKFTFIELSALQSNAVLAKRFAPKARGPIASIAEIKKLGLSFMKNGAQLDPPRPPNGAGIPQGTPLSATMSNAYMTAFDLAMKAFCDSNNALYRRYSDDILVICPTAIAGTVEKHVEALLKVEALELSAAKTERTDFDPAVLSTGKSAQYLGFVYYPGGAGLRSSSLSRAWRKMRRSVEAAKIRALKNGAPLQTKKLHKRFSPVFDPIQKRYLRSFPSYALRSASAFGSGEKISKQLARFQRGLAREIAAAKKDVGP